MRNVSNNPSKTIKLSGSLLIIVLVALVMVGGSPSISPMLAATEIGTMQPCIPPTLPATMAATESATLAAVDSAATPVTTEPAIKPALTLTEADNCQTVVMKIGEELAISLDGNPTTGFDWERIDGDQTTLAQVGAAVYAPVSNLAGAPSKITLTFAAQAAGTTTLTLIYHRSFEKNTPPAKTLVLTVTVQTP